MINFGHLWVKVSLERGLRGVLKVVAALSISSFFLNSLS